MKKIEMIPLVLSLLLCFSAAFIGSIFTYNEITGWYASLNKPFFNPPNWIFGPVWTTLYTAMGVSLYLVWIKKIKSSSKKKGILYFLIQLALNAVWSIVFFGFHSPLYALMIIVLLWIMIFLTIRIFMNISKPAAILLFPYLAWVSFASILNTAIYILNK